MSGNTAAVIAGTQTLTFTNDILGISAGDGVHYGDATRSSSGRKDRRLWLRLSGLTSPTTSRSHQQHPHRVWQAALGWYATGTRTSCPTASGTRQHHLHWSLPTTLVGIYAKGTKLRWTESGTVKYGTVVSSSFSASTLLTTVTMAVTSDYVMAANPDVSSNWISYGQPPNFPTSFTWSGATPTGITASGTFVATFSITNGICYLQFFTAVAPTSNATTFTVTGAPIANAGTAALVLGAGTDNGAAVTAVVAYVAGAATTVTLNKNSIGGAWTNSSTKSADFFLSYPI